MDDPATIRRAKRCGFESAPILPVLFISSAIIYCTGTINKEYVYYRLSEAHGLDNTTSNSECNEGNSTNTSASVLKLQEEIASETSQWSVYTNVPGLLISSLTSAIIGAWTDKVGRRPGLVLSTFGMFSSMTINCFVVYYSLPLYVLVISSIIFNIFGGFCTILACCYSYISDVTPWDKRTFAFAIAEGFMAIGGALANFGGGIWVQHSGYLGLSICLACLSVANIICAVIFINSPKLKIKDITNLILLKPAKKLHGLFRVLICEDAMWKIVVYLVCLVLYGTSLFGTFYVYIIYIVAYPFCLEPYVVGIVSAVNSVAPAFIYPFFKIFSSPFSEMAFFMVCTLGVVAGAVILALASEIWLVYFALAISVGGRTGFPVLRSQISRLVAESSQGAVFAAVAVTESFTMLIASLIFNEIYAITAKSSIPGSVFFCCVILALVYVPLWCFVFWKSRKDYQRNYNRIDVFVNGDEE